MKRFMTSILLIFTVLFGTCIPVLAEGDIRVVLDGRELVFEQPPVIVNDRTMVPMRAIFEALGATVTWDGETRTAIGNKMGVQVEFTIDEPNMYKNYVNISLDAPAALINGYTMLPVRAVAESFGVEVSWDAETRTVNMKDLNTLTSFVIDAETDYYGEAVNGVPHGYGTKTVRSGDLEDSFLTGLWENGVHVKGYLVIYLPNGFECWVEVQNGNPSGYVEAYSADGSSYQGNWKDGKWHGYGEECYPDGSVYKGYWVNGLKHGYGEMHILDRGVYKGNWENGVMHGYGELYVSDGTYYKGNYENGKMHGYGEYYYSNGGYRKGTWKDDKFLEGEALFSDGSSFVGKYRDDLPYEGIYCDEYGIYHGMQNGKLID